MSYNIRDILYLSQLGGKSVPLDLVDGGRDNARHPTAYRTVPCNEELSASKHECHKV
jgi:hypothetical protein